MPFKKPKISFEEAMAESRAERGLKALREETGVSTPRTDAPTANRVPEQAPPPPPSAPAPSKTVAPVAATVTAPPPKPSAPIRQASIPTPPPLDDEFKLALPVTAPHPAPGVSPSFDAIAADHGSRAALLAVLKRAWPALEARLTAGERLDRDATYPSSGAETTTTRRLAPTLFEAARAHLDPHGISSQRKLGRMLATAALADYFAKEAAR